MSTPPILLHTPGEPAGIGPDILLDLCRDESPACRVAVADPALLESRAQTLGLRLEVRHWDGVGHATPANTLWCQPVSLGAAARPGRLDTGNAGYVLDCLTQACELAQRLPAAIVTGPVQKSVINDAGVPFSGHTEFIAERVGGHPVMMLAAGDLRVALVTTHLPLRAVPDAINREAVLRVITIVHDDLRNRFGIVEPRLQVCGLNPHAGEAGHLGMEDIEQIAPAIAAARDRGIAATGPVPADTAFTPTQLERCDAVITMYHDQGLPVLKHAGFGNAINVTLGLPVIRTSVDHGTALALAGTGKADSGSLRAAEALALRLLR